MKRSCSTCEAWERNKSDTGRAFGKCKMYAPRVFTSQSFGQFPTMYEDNWCMEWENVESTEEGDT